MALDPIDEQFRERVRAARAMTPEERVLAGFRMFDEACDEFRARIRAHFPTADDAVVERLLREIVRTAERHGIL